MSLLRVLKRIRLELARSREFPAGSANHGYEFAWHSRHVSTSGMRTFILL
jgi:hypothetical protein